MFHNITPRQIKGSKIETTNRFVAIYRAACAQWTVNNAGKIGGKNKIIYIGDLWIERRSKDNKHGKMECICLGFQEKASNTLIVTQVRDLSKETIIKNIKQHVHPG